MLASFAGPTRRNSAAARIAMKHAVPDALSQLNVNTAAYGAGLAVTGGMRVIALCRPGTLRPFNTVALLIETDAISSLVQRSMPALIDGWPTASTAITSSR